MSRFFMIVLVSVLSACSLGQRSALPPVVDNTSETGRTGDAGDVQAYPLPSQDGDLYTMEPLEGTDTGTQSGSMGIPPSSTQPRQNSSAVIALLDRADQYGQSGQTDAAADTLERALRIEPRNARLWSKLAAVRLEQGQSEQAEQLALKSNALSQYDRKLQAENWRIVARARWARDDKTGAQRAEQKVDALESNR